MVQKLYDFPWAEFFLSLTIVVLIVIRCGLNVAVCLIVINARHRSGVVVWVGEYCRGLIELTITVGLLGLVVVVVVPGRFGSGPMVCLLWWCIDVSLSLFLLTF